MVNNMIRASFLVLSLVFISLVHPLTSFAQTAVNEDVVILEQNQIIDQDYFATGETVTILGTVNGDAYIAGGSIFIDGTINGDLMVAGGTIVIRGDISGDVRAMGGTVTISGKVDGNITVAAGTALVTESAVVGGSVVGGVGTLEVFAPIGRGMTFGAGQATIGSEVGGNILAGVGTLTLTNNASVDGDLVYYSDLNSEMTKIGSASVSGTITHTVPVEEHREINETGKVLAGFGFFLKVLSLLSALLVGMLVVFFAPNAMAQTTKTLSENMPISLVAGFVFYLLVPILTIILLVSLIGIPIAILLIPLVLFLMFFSKIFVALLIGQYVLTYVKQKQSMALTFFIGLVIYGFITAIPIIGWLISLLALFGGTGALLLYKKELYLNLRTKKLV